MNDHLSRVMKCQKFIYHIEHSTNMRWIYHSAKSIREGVTQKKSRIVGNFPYFGHPPPPPGIREIHQKMKKNFFAFLNEIDHSKQFLKKVGKMIFFWLPPPLLGKIPDNSGLFLRDAFPYPEWKKTYYRYSMRCLSKLSENVECTCTVYVYSAYWDWTLDNSGITTPINLSLLQWLEEQERLF